MHHPYSYPSKYLLSLKNILYYYKDGIETRPAFSLNGLRMFHQPVQIEFDLT